MEKRVLSFRVSEAEITALEGLRQPEDSSLGQTALRLLRGVLGVHTEVAVNAVDIKELITEKIDQAVNARSIDRELIRDEIDHRTAYLATAMNEVKSELENEIEFLKTRVKILEQNQAEKPENSPALPEMTNKDVDSLMLQEDKEDAIAPKLTEENVISPQAGKKLSTEELNREANTIFTRIKRKDTRLNRKGVKISATTIKEKIMEMYPNSEDWISDDAGLDVERALEKQHR